jgi:phosphoribosyl-ATP pyrophosphohydrolase/phosphoribosyl-AMP cyclohydrolase
MLDLSRVDFAKGNGLVTVVAQHARTGAVLMVAHADREALERTIETGEMHYRSRSRGLWHKGDTSGNVQRVVSLSLDCDGDAILARVEPAGPACHTGLISCFGHIALAADSFGALGEVIAERANDVTADQSYTRRLLEDRNLRLKKLGEESTELAVACADEDAHRATQEAADLLYHVLVALQPLGVSMNDVRAVLDARRR